MREAVLRRITDSRSLTQVNLSELEIQDAEITEIMIKLKEYKPELSKIDLDKNAITDEGACTLSEHLASFDQLTELSIQFNNIGREGAIGILGLKKTFPKLDILLHGNNLHDAGEIMDIEREAVGAAAIRRF